MSLRSFLIHSYPCQPIIMPRNWLLKSLFSGLFLLLSSWEFQMTTGRISPHSFICLFTLIGLSIYSTNTWGKHFYTSGIVFPLQLSEWFKNQSVHKGHLATGQHIGSDCQVSGCRIRDVIRTSFTHIFKDTSHHEVQEKQGKFCHPYATPWSLSCHSEHALATLTCEISKQCMWFTSLT